MRAEERMNGSDRSSYQSVYRTRWAVWSVLFIGWLCGIAAIIGRGGAVEWFLTAVITIIALISGIAPIIAAAGLEAVRTVSNERAMGGGEVEVTLVLKRAYAIPFVWLAIEDRAVNVTSIYARQVAFRTMQLAPMKQDNQITYKLKQLRRGKHQFDELTVTVGDWLGLTALHKRLSIASELIVLPNVTALQLQAGPPSSAAPNGNEHAPSAAERNAAIAAEIKGAMIHSGIGPDSRPYREGDSLRHVDWRSAARGNGLQTKLHGHEEHVRKLIAIDTLASSYDKKDQLFDAAASWTALALEEAVMYGSEAILLTGQRDKGDAGESSFESRNVFMDQQPARMAIEGARYRLADLQLQIAELRAGEVSSLHEELKEALQGGRKGGSFFVFTGNWRSGAIWGELANIATERGCRVELFVVTGTSRPTFAMREMQKRLESSGIRMTWLHVPEGKDKLPYAQEGGGTYAYAEA